MSTRTSKSRATKENAVKVKRSVGKHKGDQSQTKRKSGGKERIRYAVVGLGHIAQVAVLPAFKRSKSNSELVALVSDNEEKLGKLGKQYGVDALYPYARLEDCITDEQIDSVYIALPNSLHYDYVLRALRCGAHVLCEKPLGVSQRECQKMGRVARENGAYLMTAYRLHFDQANMEVVKLLTDGEIGEPQIFSSVFSYQVDRENIRLNPDLGGGALLDIGIYQINAARYLFQAEPISVTSVMLNSQDDRFRQVEGAVSAIMRFKENRVAQFSCSFAAGESSYYEVLGTKGKLRLENAYEYSEAATLVLEKASHVKRKKFKKHDQFSAELLYFSDCILTGRMPEPSAKEAEKDLLLIEAIEESARQGMTMEIFSKSDKPYPNQSQIITRPGGPEPSKLIQVKSPHLNGAQAEQ